MSDGTSEASGNRCRGVSLFIAFVESFANAGIASSALASRSISPLRNRKSTRYATGEVEQPDRPGTLP